MQDCLILARVQVPPFPLWLMVVQVQTLQTRSGPVAIPQLVQVKAVVEVAALRQLLRYPMLQAVFCLPGD